ncbi:hypothetical protein FGO68_gene6267 [Halteria grandinella]|uniref:TRP C-terminal domain-containing protein n=1 Tax=Halteria grandinella TaxID=5974 RepID=A0A8J8T9F4_HALGN|nr:hypothetical protein FGO68_gene6267 [Halteria grandinella]
MSTHQQHWQVQQTQSLLVCVDQNCVMGSTPFFIQAALDELYVYAIDYNVVSEYLIIGGVSKDFTMMQGIDTDVTGYYPMIMKVAGTPKEIKWTKYMNGQDPLQNGYISDRVEELATDRDGNTIIARTKLGNYFVMNSNGALLNKFSIVSSEYFYSEYMSLKNMLITNDNFKYIYVQTLAINSVRLEISKIDINVNQGGAADTVCMTQTTDVASNTYPQGLQFNFNQVIFWSAALMDSSLLLITGIKSSDCSVLSEPYRFNVAITDVGAGKSSVLRYQDLSSLSNQKNMLVFALMNKDATLLSFHVGLEDKIDNSKMTFQCFQQTHSSFADIVLLDIQIRSNNLLYVAAEVYKYYFLLEINFIDKTIITKTTLDDTNSRFLKGCFLQYGPQAAHNYYYIVGHSVSYRMRKGAGVFTNLQKNVIQIYSTDLSDNMQTVSPETVNTIDLVMLDQCLTISSNKMFAAGSWKTIAPLPNVQFLNAKTENPFNYIIPDAPQPFSLPVPTPTYEFQNCLETTIQLISLKINTSCSGSHIMQSISGGQIPTFMSFFNSTNFNFIKKIPDSALGTYDLVYKKVYNDGSFDAIPITMVVKDDGCVKLDVIGSNLPDMIVPVGTIGQYDIPAVLNAQGGYSFQTTSGTSIISQNTNAGGKACYLIQTNNPNDIGEYTFTFYILDAVSQSAEYRMRISIVNNPPEFTIGDPHMSFTVSLNQQVVYTLPSYVDPDGHQPIKLKLILVTAGQSSCIDFLDGQTISILCTDSNLSGKSQDYLLTMKDPYGASTDYHIILAISSDPPIFLGRGPSNLNMQINEKREVFLPPIVSAFSDSQLQIIHDLVPLFVNFDKSTKSYSIYPFKKSHLGIFSVKLRLKDPLKESQYSFTIKVTNKSPVLTSLIKDQSIILGVLKTYTLPTIYDPEEMEISIKIDTNPFSDVVNIQGNMVTLFASKESQIDQVIQVTVYYTDTIATPKLAFFTVYIYEDLESLNAGMLQLQNENKNNTSKPLNTDDKKKLYRVSLKITKVTRMGGLTLKVVGQSANAIARQMNNQSLGMWVMENELLREQPVSFEIDTIKDNLIYCSVQYPEYTSSSNEPDKIQLVMTKSMSAITSLSGNVALLKIGTSAQASIPTQMSAKEQEITLKFQQALKVVEIVAIPGGVVLNFLLSVAIQYLWGLLNDLSFLTTLTLISISVPGMAQTIQASMLNCIYLDVLQTDQWFIPWMFGKSASISTEGTGSRRLQESEESEDEEDDEPLNEYIGANGFGSKNLIKNLQSTFLYLVLLLIITITVPIILVLHRCFQKLQTPDRLIPDYVCNSYIRFLTQQYSPLIFSALINLYDMKIDSRTFGGDMSSVLSPAIFFCLFCAIIYLTKLVKNNNLQSPQFVKRYGNIVEGLRIESPLGRYWNIITFARWTVVALVIICMRDYGNMQVITLALFSIAVQITIIFVKPMENNTENLMSITNEVFVSFYLYTLLAMTGGSDFMPSLQEQHGYREMSGIILISVVFVSVFINVVKLIGVFYVALKLRVIRFIAKKRITSTKVQKYSLNNQTQNTNTNTPDLQHDIFNDKPLSSTPKQYLQPNNLNQQITIQQNSQIFLKAIPSNHHTSKSSTQFMIEHDSTLAYHIDDQFEVRDAAPQTIHENPYNKQKVSTLKSQIAYIASKHAQSSLIQ